jgi:hypothetical protein
MTACSRPSVSVISHRPYELKMHEIEGDAWLAADKIIVIE